MRKFVIGIGAGVIAFAWVMASWMVMPWHKATINPFKGGELASLAITQAAPESGIYAFPGMDATKEQIAKGPRIFVSISHKGKNPPVCMALALVIQCLAGLVITCLIHKSGVVGFKNRMLLVLKGAVFAGLVAVLPNWIWWSFSTGFVLLGFADLVIGWSLAGILIAKKL
jgi:hypothetical protein